MKRQSIIWGFLEFVLTKSANNHKKSLLYIDIEDFLLNIIYD